MALNPLTYHPVGGAFFRVYGQSHERLCPLPVCVLFHAGSAEKPAKRRAELTRIVCFPLCRSLISERPRAAPRYQIGTKFPALARERLLICVAVDALHFIELLRVLIELGLCVVKKVTLKVTSRPLSPFLFVTMSTFKASRTKGMHHHVSRRRC